KSSVVTILQPGGEQYGKKLKITNDLTGFNKLLFILNGICSNFSIKPKIFMESTGLYHILLYNYFSKSDFKCYILNPIHTKNFAKQSIRKVKNDKIDSLRIAQLAQSPTFSIDSSFDERYFVLKKLCREYDSFVSHKALYKKKLLSSLNLVFPKFNKIFGDTFSAIPLTILSHYPTYIDFLNADKNSVLELIISTVNHSLEWAEKKYKLILDVALEAKELKIQVSYLGSEIKCFIDIINHFDKACNKIKEDLSILHEEIPGLKHNVELLCSHPEVGFMSAVSFLSEIGDINNFKNAKKVVAFLGVDTSVSQSGDFTSTKNRLTKRGSRLGRKVL
ncbi:IS110 family transposase, partial [Clostridium sediminicola]|uniref:IS110 family transposase n=1 Tax=Clostridium sediminicola TaxID=3114879 RepID=UPI003D16813D